MVEISKMFSNTQRYLGFNRRVPCDTRYSKNLFKLFVTQFVLLYSNKWHSKESPKLHIYQSRSGVQLRIYQSRSGVHCRNPLLLIYYRS